MPCYEPYGYKESDSHLIDGECPDCGEPTVQDEAFNICGHAPEIDCKTCGSAPCTGYC